MDWFKGKSTSKTSFDYGKSKSCLKPPASYLLKVVNFHSWTYRVERLSLKRPGDDLHKHICFVPCGWSTDTNALNAHGLGKHTWNHMPEWVILQLVTPYPFDSHWKNMSARWLQPRNQLSAHFKATLFNYTSPFFVDSTPKFLGFQEVHTKEPHHKIGKSWQIRMKYPLVNVYITMENHHVEWVN